MGTESNIVLILPGAEPAEEGPGQDWLSQLGSNLGMVLKRYAGTNLQSLTPESRNSAEALKNASVLVPLLSNAYPDGGKYASFLREAFSAAAPGSLILLITSPVNGSGHPGVPPDTPSVELYENVGGRVRLLDEGETYWSRLLDLAAEIKSAGRGGPDPGMPGKTVFLSQSSGDMSRSREILKRELVEQGYHVVPVSDLLNHEQELKSHIQNLIDRSVLAIHMLGNEYGETVKESGLSLAEMQVLYAGEYLEAIENDPVHASSSVSRLIWIDPGFNPGDRKQEDFLNRLKRDLESLHRTEIVQTPLELFKTLVINKLKNLEREAGPPQTAEGKEGFLYLVHSPDARQEVSELSEGLQSEGIETRMLDYKEDQAALLNEHKQCLKECRGAVVYCGRPDRPWLRSKVLDLLKAPGLGRAHPLHPRMVVTSKKDLLEDYLPPEGIALIREPDLRGVQARIMETLKP